MPRLVVVFDYKKTSHLNGSTDRGEEKARWWAYLSASQSLQGSDRPEANIWKQMRWETLKERQLQAIMFLPCIHLQKAFVMSRLIYWSRLIFARAKLKKLLARSKSALLWKKVMCLVVWLSWQSGDKKSSNQCKNHCYGSTLGWGQNWSWLKPQITSVYLLTNLNQEHCK